MLRVPENTSLEGHCLAKRNPTNGQKVVGLTYRSFVEVAGTFEVANARESVAVMFMSQADPGFDGSDITRAPVRDPKTLIETLAPPPA